MRVTIEPGNDLIGRFGDTVVLISRSGGEADESAPELLALVNELATDRTAPATTVAARLASWVLGHLPGNIAPFGIVAPVPDGVVVFLRGPVQCTVAAGGEVRHFSGEQALTWVDQVLPGTFDSLTIGGTGGSGVQADPISDLQAGVIPGAGFMVNGADGPAWVEAASSAWRPQTTSEPEPEPEPEFNFKPDFAFEPKPEPEPEPMPEPAPVDVTMLDESGPSHEFAPIGGTAESAALPGAAAERPLGGHHRHATGPGMPVPRVGTLRSQDGQVIVLDRRYVIGREPTNDATVRNGEADPVRLHDPENVISRVHAKVFVVGGNVLVQDNNSAQGTYIGAPGDAEWTRLGTDKVPLLPGWSMRIGQHVYTYQLDGTDA